MIINFIYKNFKTRETCLNALMGFHLIHKDSFKTITDVKALDTWADMKLPMLQMTLSTIYLLIDDGKVDDALQFYKEQIEGNYGIFNNRATEAFTT